MTNARTDSYSTLGAVTLLLPSRTLQPNGRSVHLLIQQIFMEHPLGAQQHNGKQESCLQSLLVRGNLGTTAAALSTHEQNPLCPFSKIHGLSILVSSCWFQGLLWHEIGLDHTFYWTKKCIPNIPRLKKIYSALIYTIVLDYWWSLGANHHSFWRREMLKQGSIIHGERFFRVLFP